MSDVSRVRFFLIAGLAFVFLYFGVDKFLHPLIWISWMPTWLEGQLGQTRQTWLAVTGVIEIIIGSALLFPSTIIRKTGALVAALHLVAVLTQTGWNDIAVRDIGLLLMAIALFFS